MNTISVANQKGGVGKTTMAVNLSAELARMGKRVLLIDMDAQCNTTSISFRTDAIPEGNLYTVLTGKTTAAESIVEIGQNLWLLPGSPDMKFFDDQDEGVMKRMLAGLRELDRFDIVLIDNPPALDNKTMNAFAASQFVLIVAEPGRYSIEGIRALLNNIQKIRKIAHVKKFRYGIVINRMNNRRGLNKGLPDRIRTDFRGHVFDTCTGDYTQVQLSEYRRQPLCEAYPKCKSRTQFRAVALELLQRLEGVK